MDSTKIKICGTTSVRDAQMAEDAGVDFLGILVNVPFSERSLPLKQALVVASSIHIPWVAVTYGATFSEILTIDRAFPHAIQVMDDSTPARTGLIAKHTRAEVWKSIFLPPSEDEEKEPDRLGEMMRSGLGYVDSGVKALLVDTATRHSRGGTGRKHDWRITAEIARLSAVPVFLSGGISPSNVTEAIQAVGPYGVDLCSGVEREPGIRDAVKLRDLVAAVRSS
jgi:phosphoribosylanthranilate isomerase